MAAKLLLKARPTPSQLADRLRPVDGVWPDGVELYLAAADLSDIDAIAERINSASVPAGFAWLIEGPVDSLDGADFDVTRESEADLHVIHRLAGLAQSIGARAVNIHVISPSPDLSRLTLECRSTLLGKATEFLKRFVELMRNAGTVPTVEHMPPVLRMRRADYAFTPIGMASEDFRQLVDRVPELRVLADTSHAGLYLNARRLPPDPDYAWTGPLLEYLAQLPPEADNLSGYLSDLPALENAQVSNAAGLLGEGLPYAEGDFDLDPVMRWLSTHTRHIVTETLESDNDNAVHMRDALKQIRMAVS